VQVVNAVSDPSSGQVVLYSRDAENNLIRTKERGEHVFYLRAGDVTADVRRELRSEPGASFDEKEPGWVRLSCRDWFARKHLVDLYEARGIPTHEGDLNPVKRLVADRADLEIAKPRRCYLDLETDSRVPFSKKEEMRILCWALTDDAGNTTAGVLEEDTDEDERALLKDLLLALDGYDQVNAWNGDGFDFPVLAARVKKAKWDPWYLKRWLWMDQMACFKRMNMHAAESGDEKQSFALQNIGMAVLGRGKTPFDASKTYQEWAAGGDRRYKLVDYCCDDVELLPDLERARPYLDLQQAVCETCAVFPDSWSLKPTAFVDGFAFRLGKARGHHFRTKTCFDEQAPFAGALRGEVPKNAGILRDVHAVDFASMYPTIIRTFNISPETAAAIPCNGPVPEGFCRTPKTGKGFKLEPEGILAGIVSEIMRQRVAWKERGQRAEPGSAEEKLCEQMVSAMKIINNSVFGVAASPGSRYADRGIGEAITQVGVWGVSEVAAAIDARGWRQISIDTDGVMFQGATAEGVKEFVREVNEKLLPPKVASFGCRENFLSLDYALEFSRLIYISTGKYAARLNHRKGKPWHEGMEPEIKGVEYVRGDSLKLARQLQGEVIDLLCGGLGLASGEVPTDDVARYVEAVERHRAHVLSDELTVDEVKVSKSMSKGLGDYAQKIKKDGSEGAQPPHVRVAKILAARGEDVSEGTKVSYVVTDGDNGTVIPASDYAGEVDRAYLWNHLVFPATLRLLDAAFPGEDWKRFEVQRAAGKKHGAGPQIGLFGG
jgi:DNA polymerase elongation subunit (family B)